MKRNSWVAWIFLGRVGVSTRVFDIGVKMPNTRYLFGGFVGDDELPSYVGIITNNYKDPC